VLGVATEPRSSRRSTPDRQPARSGRKSSTTQRGVSTVPRETPKKAVRLRIRLRECVQLYQERTGDHMSYRDLARKSGLSPDTIKKISNRRRHYNATLHTIERLCAALQVNVTELLDWRRD